MHTTFGRGQCEIKCLCKCLYFRNQKLEHLIFLLQGQWAALSRMEFDYGCTARVQSQLWHPRHQQPYWTNRIEQLAFNTTTFQWQPERTPILLGDLSVPRKYQHYIFEGYNLSISCPNLLVCIGTGAIKQEVCRCYHPFIKDASPQCLIPYTSFTEVCTLHFHEQVIILLISCSPWLSTNWNVSTGSSLAMLLQPSNMANCVQWLKYDLYNFKACILSLIEQKVILILL